MPWNLKPVLVLKAHIPKLSELFDDNVNMGILEPSNAHIRINGYSSMSDLGARVLNIDTHIVHYDHFLRGGDFTRNITGLLLKGSFSVTRV